MTPTPTCHAEPRHCHAEPLYCHAGPLYCHAGPDPASMVRGHWIADRVRNDTHIIACGEDSRYQFKRAANQFRVVLKRPDVQQPESGGVNGGVNDLFDVISKNPGLRAPALAKLMGLTPKKVEHWIRQLRQDQRIGFIGSPKTGGYRCL